MLRLEIKKIKLKFNFPAGTSRGVLKEKISWIIKLSDNNGNSGYGEAGIIPGLSLEDEETCDRLVKLMLKNFKAGHTLLEQNDQLYPSFRFAFETAFLDLNSGGERKLFGSPFVSGKKGIPINGLVWMNPIGKMKNDADKKIEEGFSCLKFKIGALNWEDELSMLKNVRKKYGNKLEIRLDANGAFNAKNVFKKLEQLFELNIHSIEQPVPPRNYKLLKKMVDEGHTIALDEELIGKSLKEVQHILDSIKPHYLVLKPSLLGGMAFCDHIVQMVEKSGKKWWATSALESNIGLNAIAQWVSSKKLTLPQGLGTGALYKNNIPSPLEVRNGKIFYDTSKKWKMPF